MVTIRPYADDDLEAVLTVWYEASKIAHSFLPAEFFDLEREEIAARWLPIAETIVFEVDQSVEGFLALIGNEVGAIFVHPEAQGRGIGRALMDAACSRRALLELSVFEANALGRRFYDRYGFEQVGRETDDRTGQAELRLRLTCPDRDASGTG